MHSGHLDFFIMGLFRGKSRREVVVYSMGRDGSAAVHNSLSICPQVRTRQVYTLDRTKIANMNLRDGDVPDHIVQSDRILREGLTGKVPHYFITMVHDPFTRHVRQCFYLLQHQTDDDGIGYALSNAEAMRAHFDSVPAAQTTNWFQEEYLAATGIDVFAAPFDHARGCHEFRLGIHRLLLISAHLSVEKQTRIISDFLDIRIPPILPEKSTLDGLRDLFTAQIMTGRREHMLRDFWYTRMAQHFFSARQIGSFQAYNDNISQTALSMQDTVDSFRYAGNRDRILGDALSPATQVQALTADLSIMTAKRGPDAIARMTDSILKQIQRAQKNILLAGIRAIGEHYPRLASALGERWLSSIRDERITRSLSTTMQRASFIKRPLALLESMQRDAQQEAQYQRLLALKNLMDAPYPFSPRMAPRYHPIPRTVLYNPHQALPFHTSGYATRTQGLAKALRNSGYDVQMVVRAGYPIDTRIDNRRLNCFEQDGVPYFFDTGHGNGQWDLPIDAYIDRAASYLVDHALHFKPGILHTASNYICGMAGIEAARRLGIPSVYEMRGLWHITHWSRDDTYDQTDKFILAQKQELECARACDHVLAITGALKDWLIDHGIDKKKITVAPNAVDLNQFQTRSPDHAFAAQHGCSGKIVIGYIGSFVQYEGLDLLIHAVAMLPETLRQQIKLLWLGDGPVLPDLLQLAAETGITDCVVSLGRRPFEEVPQAYSIVDIAAFPRKGQAICEIVSPLKPFEAMAMGKAVIASNVRPLKDIVTHNQTGLLHGKDDAESLSSQLARVIADQALREKLGKNARAWVERTRSWDQIAATVTDVYGRLA